MQTKGEYRVGIDFNPSADDMVGRIKRASADLIDLIETIHTPAEQPYAGEVARLKAHAQTLVEDAAMNAVKAQTKKAPEGVFATPSAEASDTTPLDAFELAVREGVMHYMMNLGPWSHPIPETTQMRLLKHLENRGFRNATIEDVNAALPKIRRMEGK